MVVTPEPQDQTRPDATPRQAPRALLLANFKARRVCELLRPGIEQLRDAGIEVMVQRSKRLSDLGWQVKVHRNHVDFVIVGGGDGTLNRVADSLVKYDLPMGLLPLGTANDLARTLGIPLDIREACQVIIDGYSRRIDLGLVNGKHFFNVASLGLSVRITHQLNTTLKRRWGVLAYLIATFSVLSRSRPFRAEIRCGDERFELTTMQIAVGNGRFYGGGMVVAHDAAIDDQQLDLYSIEVDHWWNVPRLLRRLRQGRLRDTVDVRTLRGKEFEIHTHRSMSINTDGELTATTPATFRVVPNALAVFVPASSRGDGSSADVHSRIR